MRLPSVLVPYAGPLTAAGEQDIAIYLRPESNGVRVESTLMRVLRGRPRLRETFRLVYLANLPGSFISARNVVSEHYATRILFARAGGRAFTAGMKSAFERAFGRGFQDAAVVGSYEAMRLFDLGPEELFGIRVPEDRFTTILGQTVKEYRGVYIVNYDVPALLLKHTETSDVFTMLLRSGAGYQGVTELLRALEDALRQEEIVSGDTPISRVIHHSGGPFEETRDCLGYLYAPGGEPVPLGELSFARYLIERGEDPGRIREAVRHPIVRLVGAQPEEVELFEYTRGDSYPTAGAKWESVAECVPLAAPGEA